MNRGEKQMREHLLSVMDKKNISQNYLADRLGVSAGVVNKFFGKKKEISFDIVWKIVRFVDPDKKIELLNQYSPEVTGKNLKLALEFFSINAQKQTLSELLERCRAGNAELKEWARVYGVFHDFMIKVHTDIETVGLFNMLRRVDVALKETRFVLYSFEMYTYFYRNEYKLLYSFLMDLNILLIDIEHPFLRRSFHARADEILCHIELKHFNNPMTARMYSDRVLEHDIADNLNATAYFVKGLSYILEDFNKCIYNLQKCKDHYDKTDRQTIIDDMRNQIEMAHVIWDKNIAYTSPFHQALFDVKQGHRAVSDLDQYMSIENRPYIFLIKGIVLKDINFLYTSLIHFKNIGDRFRANIPKLELIKLGINETMLTELLSHS